MGLICAWGIRESVIFAGLMTLLEIGGLLAIIVGGFFSDPDLLMHIDQLMPAEWSSNAIVSIIQASLLAFFAFIGFEGISNIAEETIEPRKTLPKAILLTLAISTVIYVLVVSVALLTVGPEDLATQPAPLSHLFERTTGLPATIITLIAIFATLNGVIVQIIMVSRLSYGLSSRGLLPAFLGTINERTQHASYCNTANGSGSVGDGSRLPGHHTCRMDIKTDTFCVCHCMRCTHQTQIRVYTSTSWQLRSKRYRAGFWCPRVCGPSASRLDLGLAVIFL